MQHSVHLVLTHIVVPMRVPVVLPVARPLSARLGLIGPWAQWPPWGFLKQLSVPGRLQNNCMGPLALPPNCNKNKVLNYYMALLGDQFKYVKHV